MTDQSHIKKSHVGNPAFRLSDTKELLLIGYSFMKHLDLTVVWQRKKTKQHE